MEMAIPKRLEAFVRRTVEEGHYGTGAEVVADALRLMQVRDEAAAMKRERLRDKLTGYLLNLSHRRGAAKARLLLNVGYRPDNPQALEADLRTQHLSLDVTGTSTNAYGVVYEIEAPITAPNGRPCGFAPSGRSTLEPNCPDSLPCTRGSRCPSTCTATWF